MRLLRSFHELTATVEIILPIPAIGANQTLPSSSVMILPRKDQCYVTYNKKGSDLIVISKSDVNNSFEHLESYLRIKKLHI